MDVRQPDHEWIQDAWHLHLFRERCYTAWVLYYRDDVNSTYVSCGSIVDGKLEEMDRIAGPGMPRIGKRLLKEIERVVDGMDVLL